MSFGFFQNPSRSEKENNFKVQVATDQICCKWNFLATFKVRTALDHNFLAKKVDKYAYMLYRSKIVKIFRAKTKRRKVPWAEVAIGKNFTLNLVQQKVAHASSMPQVTPEVLNYGLWSRPMGWLGLLGSKKKSARVISRSVRQGFAFWQQELWYRIQWRNFRSPGKHIQIAFEFFLTSFLMHREDPHSITSQSDQWMRSSTRKWRFVR